MISRQNLESEKNICMSYLLIKRFIDLIIGLLGLLIISPLFVLIILLNLLFHGYPFFFFQKRPGKEEKIFKMYKFRTMTNETDEYGNPLPDHKRLTRFGKFLRKTSLDELPELINIINGDMSLVGPRPLLVKYLPFYTEREKLRHKVKPGLTGLSQVNGRNTLNWAQRLSLDVLYVEQLSLKLDFLIILKTIKTVFVSSNIQLNMIPDLDDERRNVNV